MYNDMRCIVNQLVLRRCMSSFLAFQSVSRPKVIFMSVTAWTPHWQVFLIFFSAADMLTY